MTMREQISAQVYRNTGRHPSEAYIDQWIAEEDARAARSEIEDVESTLISLAQAQKLNRDAFVALCLHLDAAKRWINTMILDAREQAQENNGGRVVDEPPAREVIVEQSSHHDF